MCGAFTAPIRPSCGIITNCQSAQCQSGKESSLGSIIIGDSDRIYPRVSSARVIKLSSQGLFFNPINQDAIKRTKQSPACSSAFARFGAQAFRRNYIWPNAWCDVILKPWLCCYFSKQHNNNSTLARHCFFYRITDIKQPFVVEQ